MVGRISRSSDGDTLPLSGIRIVECGVWHAGPGGCAILADLGAEVIKVESLGGDPERTHGKALGTVKFSGIEKDDWSVLYEISNRNKKGICVDISTQEGREVLERLVRTADVFMTNYRQSTIRKLCVDYDSIAAINKRIIHLTVSGYGEHGPLADVGGFDPMGQAISGMVFVTGEEEPVVLQALILDQITAITASHAMLTALLVRERRGYGQALHVSLYGSAVWTLYANLLGTSVLGKNLASRWDRRRAPPLRNMYRCKDGVWLIGTHHPESKYWPAFSRLLGIDWMDRDPRYASSDLRAERMEEVIEIVGQAMATKSSEEWRELFHPHGLQFIPAQRYEEVLKDPQAIMNGYIDEVMHPVMGQVRVPGYPVSFSRERTRLDPAPERGEHTRAVLGDVGYSRADIDALCERKVVSAYGGSD